MKMNQISNALNNLIFGSMLEKSEDEWQEEFEDERQEKSEDERQDALIDDALVKGGTFGDWEKQNTSKQKDNWSKIGVQKKAWSSQHLNKEEC